MYLRHRSAQTSIFKFWLTFIWMTFRHFKFNTSQTEFLFFHLAKTLFFHSQWMSPPFSLLKLLRLAPLPLWFRQFGSLRQSINIFPTFKIVRALYIQWFSKIILILSLPNLKPFSVLIVLWIKPRSVTLAYKALYDLFSASSPDSSHGPILSLSLSLTSKPQSHWTTATSLIMNRLSFEGQFLVFR